MLSHWRIKDAIVILWFQFVFRHKVQECDDAPGPGDGPAPTPARVA